MNLQRRDFLLVATLAVATVTPVSAQTVAPTVGPGGKQGAASVPDFSGVWTHSIPGFEPLASGPTALVNRSRESDRQYLSTQFRRAFSRPPPPAASRSDWCNRRQAGGCCRYRSGGATD